MQIKAHLFARLNDGVNDVTYAVVLCDAEIACFQRAGPRPDWLLLLLLLLLLRYCTDTHTVTVTVTVHRHCHVTICHFLVEGRGLPDLRKPGAIFKMLGPFEGLVGVLSREDFSHRIV